MRLRHPDGSTVHLALLHQRAPRRGPRRRRSPSSTRYAVPVRRDARRRRARARPVAGRAGRAPSWPPTPDGAPRLRRRAGRARAGGGHPQRLPVPGRSRRQVVKHAVYQPDWTTAERLRYTLDLARVLADLLPDDAAAARSRRCRWPGASRGTTAAARRGRRHLAELPAELAALAAETGRDDPGRVRARAGLRRRDHRRRPRGRWSDVDTDRLGVCLDLAHLACAWEEPAAARRPARRAPGCRWSRCRCRRRWRSPIRTRRRRAVLAGYVEPRFLHQTRSPAGAATDDLDEALAGGLPTARPGGCTSTCRCTPHRTRRCAPPPDAAVAHAGRAGRRSDAPLTATTSRSRPTPGRAAAGAAPGRRRRAGRRHRRRAGLRPGPAAVRRPGGGRMRTSGRAGRGRADPAAARPHAAAGALADRGFAGPARPGAARR